MSSIHRRSRASAIAGIGIVSVLALGACSASGSSSSQAGSEGAAPAASAPLSGDAASGEKAAAAPGASPRDANASPQVTAQTQKLVRTAAIRLSVDDVTAGAAGVRGVALGVGGMVTAEDVNTTEPVPETAPTGTIGSTGTGATTTTGPARRYDSGTVTIAVPADKLDAVLDRLGKLGAVVQRTSTSEDVTSTFVDTQSRIATMKASIARLRALMGQTTGIAQIVSLETELSQREADLEALQATLASLTQRVTMSTVVVTLASKAAPTTNPVDEGTGFVAGVKRGWTAFTGLFVGLLTVVGAVLPFVATLALIALPGLVWWRRRPRTSRRNAGVVAGSGPTGPQPQQASEAPHPQQATEAPETTRAHVETTAPQSPAHEEAPAPLEAAPQTSTTMRPAETAEAPTSDPATTQTGKGLEQGPNRPD